MEPRQGQSTSNDTPEHLPGDQSPFSDEEKFEDEGFEEGEYEEGSEKGSEEEFEEKSDLDFIMELEDEDFEAELRQSQLTSNETPERLPGDQSPTPDSVRRPGSDRSSSILTEERLGIGR